MNKKLFMIVVAIVGLTVLSFSFMVKNKEAPVVLNTSGSQIFWSLDDQIKLAELIVIGEVRTNLPSRWNDPKGKYSKNASPEEIAHAHGLFTDSIISVDQILKGDITTPTIRVRSFIGEIETVRWEMDGEPSFLKKHRYLLLLTKDTGATRKVDPGDYISVSGDTAVYEIVGDKAISAREEWTLDELIDYIEKKLSQTPTK